jgi:hypothetical protein
MARSDQVVASSAESQLSAWPALFTRVTIHSSLVISMDWIAWTFPLDAGLVAPAATVLVVVVVVVQRADQGHPILRPYIMRTGS